MRYDIERECQLFSHAYHDIRLQECEGAITDIQSNIKISAKQKTTLLTLLVNQCQSKLING